MVGVWGLPPAAGNVAKDPYPPPKPPFFLYFNLGLDHWDGSVDFES